MTHQTRHPETPTPAESAATRPHRRAGMSLLELVITLVVVLSLLGLFNGVAEALVNDSADLQTHSTLQTLQRSIHDYYRHHRTWPSASEPHNIDTPMARCMAALRASPVTADRVSDLPGLATTPAGFITIHDGYGTPLQYLNPRDPRDPSADLRTRLARNQHEQPLVASAGPDGDFGDLTSDLTLRVRAAADNLYSVDLEPHHD